MTPIDSMDHAARIIRCSETRSRRTLTAPFCQGFGVDLGSGGDPVVPYAVQIDMNPNVRPFVHCFGDASKNLPFRDGVLDYVYSSHLLEDFKVWEPILTEWLRVLKTGGYLVIMVPDHERFRAAVARGQPDNLDHKHESRPGELTEYFSRLCPAGEVVVDRLTEGWPNDYNILFVGKKR